jgi:thymidylate kinase
MDGAGKTTLINNLKYGLDDVQLEVVRNPHDDKQNFSEWWPEVADRQKSSIVPIHDRFFFSEIVYGPVLRGYINAPETLVTNIAYFLRNTALLIYARPHSDILREGVKSNQQMNGVHAHFQELLEMYDNVMMVEKQWFGDRFIRYDWNTEGSYQEVETTVRAYLNGKLP